MTLNFLILLLLPIVNDEIITSNEYYYNITWEILRAPNFGLPEPSTKEILEDLVDRKLIVADAKKRGIYPDQKTIDAYLEEQKHMFRSEDFEIYTLEALLKGWGISAEEYYKYMTDIWADSIAVGNWEQEVIMDKALEEIEDFDIFQDAYMKKRNIELQKLRDHVNIEFTLKAKELDIDRLNLYK